jgi:hypothetical protein
MKRFLLLVGVAVVAAAMYVAASPASQQAKAPTAKQFAALKKQVANLSKKLTTLKAEENSVKALVTAETVVLADCAQVAVPINQFGDGVNQTEGYHYLLPSAPTHEIITTAIDATDPADANALWIVGGGSACGTDINGTGLRHAAAKAGVRLPRASSHHFSFSAHLP